MSSAGGGVGLTSSSNLDGVEWKWRRGGEPTVGAGLIFWEVHNRDRATVFLDEVRCDDMLAIAKVEDIDDGIRRRALIAMESNLQAMICF